MDANEDVTEPTLIPLGATEVDARRTSQPWSLWRGSKTGLKWLFYVAGSIFALPLIQGLALTAYGLGAGRGLVMPSMQPDVIGFTVTCGELALIPICGIGLIVFLVSLVLPRTRTNAPSGFQRWRWPWLVIGSVFLLLAVSYWFGSYLGGIGLILALVIRRLLRTRTASWSSTDDNTPLGYHRRRWPWLVGAWVFLVLATAYGIGAVVGILIDYASAGEIAAADRDDPFWRLDDLMAHREKVPDAENSALIVKKVLALLPKDWPGPKPDPGEPTTPLREAIEVFERYSPTPENVRLDDAVADEFRRELKTFDLAVQIARTIADYRRGRHELIIGPTVMDTPLESGETRKLALLLAADGAIRCHDNDLDGALDSCRAILGVGRSSGYEPFLISALIRQARCEIALKSTRRVVGQGEPSDASLGRLQALFLAEMAEPLMLHGLRGERAMMDEVIRRLGAGELTLSQMAGSSPLGPDAPRAGIPSWYKLFFDLQRVAMLKLMNEAVAIETRDAAARPSLWKAYDRKFRWLDRSRWGKYFAVLTFKIFPDVFTASWISSRYQCELGATAILLAAERHRRKTGQWPSSIAAIDRSVLPSVPIDPFSGESFRMARRDGQLFIYSIGPNHKDENGTYEQKLWVEGSRDDFGASLWDVSLRRQPPSPEDEPPPRSTTSP
ncbi:MAG: hypothetical protein ACHRXM_19940 [Isosphaerales bacterium]